MGKYRERFNAKARAGMVAKQQALKRARNKSQYQQDDDNIEAAADDQPVIPAEETDVNAEILLPMTTEEKIERKRKLHESLKPKEEKMSKAKKKRLDKYIVGVKIGDNWPS